MILTIQNIPLRFTSMPTPLGTLVVACSPQGLSEIKILPPHTAFTPPAHWVPDAGGLAGETVTQLNAFFNGGLRKFSLPLAPRGTLFQIKLWQALERIPYGTTETYSQVAHRLGLPRGARAVGGGCGANPLPIVVPCHRVVALKGLGGYTGGLEIKQKLLALEQGENRLSNQLLADGNRR